MNVELKHFINKIQQTIKITGSKSESNRLLILQQLYPNLTIKNLSNSDDTQLLQKALCFPQEIVNIGHAGTAMRFLTAYFASQEEKKVLLTGSKRMQERPIQILVDALNTLGADIEYDKNEGFPPLKITGKKLIRNTVKIDGNISSQYISALLLIASKLENGLEVQFKGNITSKPYIEMTLGLLKALGIQSTFSNQTVKVFSKKSIDNTTIVVESDWSSASYFFSLIALSVEGSSVTLSSYKKESLQGDAALVSFYEQLGVSTIFKENQIVLTKNKSKVTNEFNADLIKSPDIAQTIAVTCFGMGIACNLTGLHTLKIKETDRLEALKNELTKLGAQITVTNNSLHIKPSSFIEKNVTIQTYDDHRMAMAFAPLLTKTSLIIENAEVVSKSYPTFWDDFKFKEVINN